MERLEMEDMAKLLKDVPPSPPEMTEKIYNEYIEKSYIIYDGKKHKAACTRCGAGWEIAPGEYARMHGLKGWCPVCGEAGQLLSAGRGRQCYTEYFRVLSFTHHNGALMAFLNEVIAKFEDMGRPELYRTLTNLYIISKDEQTRWRFRDNWYGDQYYERIKSMNVPAPPHGMGGWFGYFSKYNDYVYGESLLDAIAESDCRRLIDMPFILDYQNDDHIVPFLATCMKYHSVELLGKAGFTKIASQKIKGHGCRGINWNGKSLEKILKLPRKHVRKLRTYDPTMSELEAFQKLPDKYKDKLPLILLSDMTNWSYTRDCPEAYIKEVEKFMPFDKWIRWVATQEHYLEIDEYSPNLLRDYKDYMNTAEKLGMDIHKNSVLRPSNLKEAHDETMLRLTAVKNEAIDKAIAECARADQFRLGHLMVVPALSQEDLNKESAKLHHCVKTYGDKIANGKCWIFFIRNVDAPDEPYYTLETDTAGKFVQCRGKHNCSMTDEVSDFKDGFIKALQMNLKKERSKSACQTA